MLPVSPTPGARPSRTTRFPSVCSTAKAPKLEYVRVSQMGRRFAIADASPSPSPPPPPPPITDCGTGVAPKGPEPSKTAKLPSLVVMAKWLPSRLVTKAPPCRYSPAGT